MNLEKPEDNLKALIKTRASLKPDDVVTWFAGDVYAWTPGKPAMPVFGLEGFNIARAVEADDGYDLLTREAVFYLDPRSREIIDTWKNPFTEAELPVVHILNDPVNMQFRPMTPRGPFKVPYFEAAGEIIFKMDVFLAYPSPLTRAEFPDESQDDLYQAGEMFGFAVKKSELLDEGLASVPAHVSWTRIAPWLPFMKMADAPGHLVYHCEGAKLGSYGELPEKIKAKVDAVGPEYKTAPTEFTQPNATSWTYFKNLRAEGKI